MADLLVKAGEAIEDDESIGDYNEDDEDDDRYNHLFKSLRSETGLETAIQIHWPDLPVLELSTKLPSTEIAPLFHGTQWAGTRVWRAAIVALQYLLKVDDHRHSEERKSMLELGCGLGVPGMVLHLLKGYDTTLTDMDSLVSQLNGNLEKNADVLDLTRIRAAALDWSVEGAQELLESHGGDTAFDLVLNCDCIYEPLYGRSWEKLFLCQEELLRRNPKTLMITSIERRNHDGAEKYLARWKESSVWNSVAKLNLNQVLGEDIPQEIELYQIRGTE